MVKLTPSQIDQITTTTIPTTAPPLSEGEQAIEEAFKKTHDGMSPEEWAVFESDRKAEEARTLDIDRRDRNLEFEGYAYTKSPWGHLGLTQAEGEIPILMDFTSSISLDMMDFGSTKKTDAIWSSVGDLASLLFGNTGGITDRFQFYGVQSGWIKEDSFTPGEYDPITANFVEEIIRRTRGSGRSVREVLLALPRDRGPDSRGPSGPGRVPLNADDLKDLVKAVAGQELGRTDLTDAELDAFVSMARAGAAIGRNSQNAASEYLSNIHGAEKKAMQVASMVNAFRQMAVGG